MWYRSKWDCGIYSERTHSRNVLKWANYKKISTRIQNFLFVNYSKYWRDQPDFSWSWPVKKALIHCCIITLYGWFGDEKTAPTTSQFSLLGFTKNLKKEPFYQVYLFPCGSNSAAKFLFNGLTCTTSGNFVIFVNFRTWND